MSEVVQLTPRSTATVAEGATPEAPALRATVPAIPPELVPLFKDALDTLPPGALTQLIKKHWAVVISLALPLLLTTWTNIKQIWEGPATLAAIQEDYEADHKKLGQVIDDLAAIKKESDQAHKEIKEQIERVLWSVGPRAPLPASQPVPR